MFLVELIDPLTPRPSPNITNTGCLRMAYLCGCSGLVVAKDSLPEADPGSFPAFIDRLRLGFRGEHFRRRAHPGPESWQLSFCLSSTNGDHTTHPASVARQPCVALRELLIDGSSALRSRRISDRKAAYRASKARAS